MKKKIRRAIIEKEDLRYMGPQRRNEYIRGILYSSHFKMDKLILRRYDIKEVNGIEVLVYEQEV